MSEQNLQAAANSSSLPILPAKRRRGRPRKDGSVAEKVISSSQLPAVIPTPETKKIIQPVEVKEQAGSDVDDMVGRVVSGVIDGCFDAGYFLTVRVGNSSTLLRGVVFQPGRFSPITAATDVVPQAKMFQRREMPIPVPDLQGQNNGVIPQSDKVVNQPAVSEQVLHPKPTFSASMAVNQPPSVMVPQSGSGSVSVPAMPNISRSNSGLLSGEKTPLNLYQKHQPQSAAPPPLENLRMVEQDEVMQVFEISTQPQWFSSKVNAADVSCSEETGSQVSQTYSQRSTEPCFKAYEWDLSNPRLSQNPAMASENQVVESKMEENKSPNHDQQSSVAAQPQHVPQFQAPSEMDSEALVRAEAAVAEDKSISQEPHSESKNTYFEFNQSLAVGNTEPLPPVLINSSAMDFMMENPSAPKNDASNDSLNGKTFGYTAENAAGESHPAAVGTSEENVTLEHPGRLETQIFNSASCTLPDFRFVLGGIVSPTGFHANPSNTPENEHR